MDNKLIPVILATFVGVLLIGSVLMPVIIDADDDTKVYYNNNFGPYAQVVEGDVVSIVVSTTIGTGGSTICTVDGESVIIPQGLRAILIAENFVVYQNFAYGIGIYGIDSNGDMINNASWANVSITIDGDNISYTASVNDVTASGDVVNEWAFYRSNEGSYRIVDYISSSVTVYVNDLTQVYGSNLIATTGEYFSFNGTDVKISKLADDVTTTRDATATVQTTDVMNDVISFKVDSSRETSSSFKFITDNNGEDYEVYPYFMIVPASVYGQTESNEAYSAILFAIPVVLIMALVAIVIATFARYD